MHIRLNLVGLLVNDYDEALEYYTGVLGFQKIMDEPFTYKGDARRWVAIGLEGQSDLEINLMRAGEAERGLVGKQAGTLPFLSLLVDDAEAFYARLAERGANVSEKISDSPDCKTFTFDDLYGNQWFVTENKQPNA